ncbi:TonB-dependent receptor [Fontimonas thermophila]|uniref:TonB-dependent receptor n=1 Tax=Fontimonas thermophila TaxID=1076937 RepID=UPI001F3CE1B5|nr:TonB-dependent receptor [Fontimonas thermophila]
MDRTLTADLTAFYIEYKNPIIQQNAQSRQAGIPTGYLDNVGAAESKGIEAQLQWFTPLDGLSVSLGAAFTSAHSTVPFTDQDGQLIEPGQQMPGVAPQQYRASLHYLRPLGEFMLGLTAGYNYIGQGYSNFQHHIEINGYGTARLGLILSADAWSWRPKLAFNVDNVFDRVAATGGTLNRPLVPGPFFTYLLNAPRTYTLRLSVDF